MLTNLEKYKNDLDSLMSRGDDLLYAMYVETSPDEFEAELEKAVKDPVKIEEIKKKLPNFLLEYQSWYSEAYTFIKIILPDRLDDFEGYYKKPKNRKTLDHSNYSIEDYLHGTIRKDGFGGYAVDKSSGVGKMQQQVAVLKSAKKRFESSLFDIKQLVQADLFDSEIDVAKELLKNKFNRAAGAVAGVVLERHLHQVCENHGKVVTKKSPGISDLNDLLKAENIIDTAEWRRIQHLGDIRNLCDHDKKKEPTEDQVTDLIDGTNKTIKNLF